MTQVDRLLAALTRAGARGLTRVDFQAPNVVDGGTPILNIPGRIYDLHQAGIETVVIGERHGCSVYALAGAAHAAPETPPEPAPAAEEAPEQPPIPFPGQLAIFDDMDCAA